MMIKFLIDRKATLMFVIAVAGFLSSSPESNAAVRPLEDYELAKVIGMCKDCLPKGNACQNLAVGCAIKGHPCKMHCEHRYQNWSCGKGKYTCASDPARACGTQETGVCNSELNCEIYGFDNCGSATNCHR